MPIKTNYPDWLINEILSILIICPLIKRSRYQEGSVVLLNLDKNIFNRLSW